MGAKSLGGKADRQMTYVPQVKKNLLPNFATNKFIRLCTKTLVDCCFLQNLPANFFLFIAFFKLLNTKNLKNAYFEQCLECAAPKCWSKYTTTNFLFGDFMPCYWICYKFCISFLTLFWISSVKDPPFRHCVSNIQVYVSFYLHLRNTVLLTLNLCHSGERQYKFLFYEKLHLNWGVSC